MTHSPLTDKVMRPRGAYRGKSSSRLGVRVRQLVVHHWASTSSAGLNRLVHSSDKASANYLIRNDGTLISSVPEERRAWTSGSGSVDRRSITVEIENETGAPSWRVSAAARATLTRLFADVAKRYGFSCSRSTIRGHREFAATACPGPYLYPRLDDIARDAESIRRGGGAASRDDDRKPLAGAQKVKALQRAVHVEVDGKWGPVTDRNLVLVREASRFGGNDFPSGVKATQRAVGTKADGKWGPNSRAAHDRTVAKIQRALGVKADCIWGPITDRAWKSARAELKGKY